MGALGRASRIRLLLRSLLVQGSWNYRTMQGAGLAFALTPALLRLYGDDRQALSAALERHSAFFNAHPYLATVAVAAVARMESDGVSPDEIERFKSAIVSPLGSLGDRLVWARWRPLTALLALAVFLAGAPWWAAATVFLALYNGMHLLLRVWGLRLGWRHGRQVGRALMASPLRRLPDRLTIPLAVVSGATVPLLALAVAGQSRAGPYSVILVALALASVAAWRPTVAARLAILSLLVGSLVVVVFGNAIW